MDIKFGTTLHCNDGNIKSDIVLIDYTTRHRSSDLIKVFAKQSTNSTTIDPSSGITSGHFYVLYDYEIQQCCKKIND